MDRRHQCGKLWGVCSLLQCQAIIVVSNAQHRGDVNFNIFCLLRVKLGTYKAVPSMTHYKLYNSYTEADLQPCFQSHHKMALPADGVPALARACGLMYTAVTPRPTACLTPAVGTCNSSITARCRYDERSCIFHVAIRLLCRF